MPYRPILFHFRSEKKEKKNIRMRERTKEIKKKNTPYGMKKKKIRTKMMQFHLLCGKIHSIVKLIFI